MPRIAILIFFILLQAVQTSFAASSDYPAYRKLEQIRIGLSGFGIRLGYDEQLCRKHYGQKWLSRCSNMPGRHGAIAKGIDMNPPVQGRWQWNGADILEFVPENSSSILPDTLYSIDISKLFLPASIKLDRKSLTFHSWPLATRLINLKFMIDPSPVAKHMLILSLEFNYPVPAKFKLPMLEASGIEQGTPEVVWNNDRTVLNMAWPIHQLANEQAIARINCGKIAQIQENNDQYQLIRPKEGNSETIFRIPLPGQQDLFKIKNISLNPAMNENLDQEYELEIESSLYASPENVLKNLAILQLPKTNSPEAVEPYNWELTPAISPEALKRGKLLTPTLSSSNTPKSKFNFRIQADAGSFLLVVINSGLQSSSGSDLGQNAVKILRVPPLRPTLDFMQPGNILPLNRDGEIHLHAANLDRIHWEIRKIEEPALALMAKGQYIFENGHADGVSDMDGVSEIGEGEIVLPENGEGKAQFATLNMGRELKKLGNAEKSGLALLTLRGYRKEEAVAWTSRLILASKFGLLIKQAANGSYDCFVQDLEDGHAVANAEIQILGVNGKALSSGTTDQQGHYQSPALAGLKREKRPAAALAKKDGQLAWLALGDPARKVNYSEFRTEGIASFANGMNAFVFSQREAYQPGESLHFGLIVKNGDFSPLANDIPIWTEIIDPRGVRVHGESIHVKTPGMAEISWKAPEGAIGGKYIFNARIAQGGLIIGEKICHIGEFHPDTLKLQIIVPEYKGWLQNNQEQKKLLFRLNNLYGTPAKGQKIASSLTVFPALFRFSGYEDYIFSDPAPLLAENLKRDLPVTISDERGEASLTLPADFNHLPSARIRVAAEGFEAGGGHAVTQTSEFLVSPAEKLLGYRPRGATTNLQFIPAGTDAQIELIALDNKLRKKAWENLDFSISRKEYATSLVSDAMGGYKYDETPVINPLKTWRASLPENGMACSLPTDRPGEYILSVASDGKVIAETPFTIAGVGSRAPGQSLESSKIRAKTDKTEYESGEKVQISLALPYDGHGLITLERDGVEAFVRFSAKAGETLQSLALPENFEGKGYIVVSFARSADSPAIFMNPHACSVLPIMANMKKRDMGLKISAPETVSPGGNILLEISSKTPGKAIVFAVDEGMHLLTGYQQPKPLNELLGNRALNVASIHAYDLLMPTNLQFRNSAFGGGMDGGASGHKFRNPFKRKNEPPLAFWSSIIETGPEKKTLTIAVPTWYNGNARIYACGVTDSGAGSASASTLVTAPVILTPALPLAVSPHDSFDGSLLIENTTPMDRIATLATDYGTGLDIVSPFPESIKIPANSGILLSFRAVAQDAPGIANLKFSVMGKDKVFAREASLSIRPAGMFKTSFLSGRAEKATILDLARRVYENNASCRVLLSPLPLPLADGFKQFLEFYPHGCTEQLISRAFAMLVSGSRLKNNEKPEKQIAAALAAIRGRAGASGLAFWPGGEGDLLLTAYATDFLLALRTAGISHNQDLLDQLCQSIESQAVLNSSSLVDARNIAYGIWVLTREGRITTQLIENLIQTMNSRQIDGWERDITSALLAASLKEMHVSRNLPAFERLDYDGDGYFDEYAQRSLHFYILSRTFPEHLDEKLKNDFFEATQETLNSGNFATFSASQGARALLAATPADLAELFEANVECVDNDNGRHSILEDGKTLEYETSTCSRLKLDIPENGAPLFWQVAISGHDREAARGKEENGLTIERSYLDRQGEKTSTFSQGDEITVVIEARSLNGEIRNCVIADMLPGGTEMIFEKNNDGQFPENTSYTDRQEDRMLIYTTLDENPFRASYRIRAVNKGEFLAPGIRAEAMYSPDVSAQGMAGKLRIQ